MSDVRASYDAWHAGRAPDVASDTPWHNQLKHWLPPLGGKRVLEIACGRGGFTLWLASRDVEARPQELIAADFSEVAVNTAAELGRAHGATGVTYRREDLTALSFASESFDIAVSCETIEHLPDPRSGLYELARVLRRGGKLYLTCPNYLNLIGAHRLYRSLIGRPYTEEGQPIDHVLMMPRVLVWLREAGLRLEKVGGVGHYLPFPGRPPLRLRALDSLPLSKLMALHTAILAVKP